MERNNTCTINMFTSAVAILNNSITPVQTMGGLFRIAVALTACVYTDCAFHLLITVTYMYIMTLCVCMCECVYLSGYHMPTEINSSTIIVIILVVVRVM